MREYTALLAEVMARMYRSGLIDVKGGNASIRVKLGDVDLVLITPGGVAKDSISPEDIAALTLKGVVIYGKPSSEYRLHLEIYRAIREAVAVVHAHNPLATIIAASIPLETFMPEAIDTCITRVPHLPAGSPGLAKETAKRLASSGCRIAVLEAHGVVALGVGEPREALIQALDLIEAVENAAKRALAALALGASVAGSLVKL